MVHNLKYLEYYETLGKHQTCALTSSHGRQLLVNISTTKSEFLVVRNVN